MHHASAKSFHVNAQDVADRMLESKSGTKLLLLDDCSHLYLCTYGWYGTSNLLSGFLILSLETHNVECVQGIYDGCTKSAKLIVTSFWLRLRKHKLPQLASREGTFPQSLPQSRERIPNISERGVYWKPQHLDKGEAGKKKQYHKFIKSPGIFLIRAPSM